MTLPSIQSSFPKYKDLFYNGDWHSTREYKETINPANGQIIDHVAQASIEDVDFAVQSARNAFLTWRSTDRAPFLRKAAEILRQHAAELALVDALDTGNPVAEMLSDAKAAAAQLEYFAGLIPMIKGETIPGPDFHYTIREPLGVVARIVAFNHPVMFAGSKLAAPLAAGNTVIVKPPDQAPLSCLKLAELLGQVFPPGVISILPGGVECGKALTEHPEVAKVTLIGSVPTGKAIQKSAAETLKPTLLELGGKNALVAFPDADISKLVQGVARGMNFTWAGQSCGSTSRVFLHESLHDRVLEEVTKAVQQYKPGVPTEMSTTMGPLISKAAHERVLSYIESGKSEGAKLVTGGEAPGEGYFVLPTIFSDVKPNMRIAREEIFGPVMSVFKWTNEEEMFRQVNDTKFGLTASIYTRDLAKAQKAVGRIEAGFIWVNQVGRHFLGVPFGGMKESGLGREESLDELLSFTQIKSVNVSLA